MSINQVLETTKACLADATVGLGARVQALASTASIAPELVRVDFNFVKWQLSGAMQPSLTPNVMLRPVTWEAKLKDANIRDAVAVIQVAAEYFDASTDVLQDNIAIAAAALGQVMDGLRDYSDAHGGTVIDVIDPIKYVFGDFTGPTSSGFTATIQIEERSAQ